MGVAETLPALSEWTLQRESKDDLAYTQHHPRKTGQNIRIEQTLVSRLKTGKNNENNGLKVSDFKDIFSRHILQVKSFLSCQR